MQMTDIAGKRLQNQYLLQANPDPLQVLRSFGAMQAQDFAGAKWALGQRTKNTDTELVDLFNEGKILRTHMLRPTWHFVLPEDIAWIQQLAAPRVHAFNKYYYKQLELDTKTLQKGAEVLAKALQGKQLQRSELKTALETNGINAEGLRLAYLIMYAELENVITSGALQGKQHTYSLLAERVPKAKQLTGDEALGEFTRRYFTTHGPATIQDFAWWSSLTVADIKKGIALANLKSFEVEDVTFYYDDDHQLLEYRSPIVRLLPNYDEFTVAYKERRPYNNAYLSHKPTYEDLSYHVITIDGQVVGGWKWAKTKSACKIQLNWFREISKPELAATDITLNELGLFLNLKITTI